MTAEKAPKRVLNFLAGVIGFSLNHFLQPKHRMFLLTRCGSHGNPGVEEKGITYCHTTGTEDKREEMLQKEIRQHRKEPTHVQV